MTNGKVVRMTGNRVANPSPPEITVKVTVETGELCNSCGGLLIRTGTCLTCQGCGNSSGGCG